MFLTKDSELAIIANEIKNCERCQLCNNRNKTVPGEGNINTEIILVAEAPGATEDSQGRPLIGKAGQLLDDCLKLANIKREDLFITNVVKCRPPDNRVPKDEEILSCLPYLYEQIKIINPKLIVAAGKTAIHSLTIYDEVIGSYQQNTPISHLIQQPTYLFNKISRRFESVVVYPIYHPSYILRNLSRKLDYIGSIMNIHKTLEYMKNDPNWSCVHTDLFDKQKNGEVQKW